MSIFDLPNAPSTPNAFEKTPLPIHLDKLELQDLLALRALIDEKLPVKSLKDLNIEQELTLQLLSVQGLQRDVLTDDDTPANQKAQTANAVAAALATLAKLQIEVYNSERLKRVEQVLIETLQTLPPEAQEAFLQLYEERLGKL